jgi:glucose 1-dehydrogenase
MPFEMIGMRPQWNFGCYQHTAATMFCSADGRPVPTKIDKYVIPKCFSGPKGSCYGCELGYWAWRRRIALGKAGADVAVNYIDGAAAADDVVQEISRSGTKALQPSRPMSPAEAEVSAMFESAIKELGTIDILVANAGLQRDAAFQEMTLDEWNKVLSVNLTGQFLCAQAATREFLRRGVVPTVSKAAGKIICMSSVHQTIPWGGHANYATSKGAIKMLMESIAQELAPRRIRVNGIAPGAIRTPINTSAWNTQEALKQLLTLIPYGRIGEPEDIARAVVWLASDDSDYVVGATLFVDGGMTLYPGFATGG